MIHNLVLMVSGQTLCGRMQTAGIAAAVSTQCLADFSFAEDSTDLICRKVHGCQLLKQNNTMVVLWGCRQKAGLLQKQQPGFDTLRPYQCRQ